MAARVAAGGGDVGGAGESVQADGEVAQGGQHSGTGSGADLGVAFGEDDVVGSSAAYFRCSSARRKHSAHSDFVGALHAPRVQSATNSEARGVVYVCLLAPASPGSVTIGDAER